MGCDCGCEDGDFYDDFNDFWDDDYDDDLPSETGAYEPEAEQGNSASAPSFTGEQEVGMSASVGQTFSTGNSTVRGFAEGTVLKVASKWDGGRTTLEVVSVPKVSIKEGDRFLSKYGPATAIRVTTTYDLNEVVADAIPADSVVYVADGTNVVRVTSVASVKPLK